MLLTCQANTNHEKQWKSSVASYDAKAKEKKRLLQSSRKAGRKYFLQHSNDAGGRLRQKKLEKNTAQIVGLAPPIAPSDALAAREVQMLSTDDLDMLDELNRMLELSSLIYAFAKLRNVVNAGGVPTSWLPFSGRKQLENFDIIANNCENPDHHHKGVLKHPIAAEQIGKVMTENNMKLLASDKEIASELNLCHYLHENTRKECILVGVQ